MKSGFFGLLSNGTGGAYWDLLEIIPIDCKNQID
jgi:hypothetical protein